MKRFKITSLYFDNKCNLNCSMCYTKNKTGKNKKSHKWFLDSAKYIAEISEQCAFAGYEPFLFPSFVKAFSKKLKNKGVIANITTNGRLIKKFTDKQLKDTLKDITMVSISYDSEKIKTIGDITEFKANVKRLNKLKVRVGCNLLLNEGYLKMLPLMLEQIFSYGVERVFLLHIKPCNSLNIRPYLPVLREMSKKYPKLYVDDFILQVSQYGYKNWKGSCHFGKESVSIDCFGNVSGCSFANPLFTLNKPKDILKLKDYKFKELFECVMKDV